MVTVFKNFSNISFYYKMFKITLTCNAWFLHKSERMQANLNKANYSVTSVTVSYKV